MPRVKQYGPDYSLVPRRIRAKCALDGRQLTEFQPASGLAYSTFFSRLRQPQNLTLKELVHISAALRVPLEELLKGVTA